MVGYPETVTYVQANLHFAYTNYKVGMSQILHWRNTLQTLEYLALGTLSRILNTTIVFYGWFPNG